AGGVLGGRHDLVGAAATHEQAELVLLDHLRARGHGLAGVVAVVLEEDLDLAPVDPALVVEEVEVNGLAVSERSRGEGRRAGDWRVDADTNLGVGHAAGVADAPCATARARSRAGGRRRAPRS